MKLKSFIPLFIFGLFLFLLPSLAEASCVQSCGADDIVGTYNLFGEGAGFYNRLGYMGAISCTGSCPPIEFASCTCGYSGYDQSKCGPSCFPSGSWTNGQTCTALDFHFSFPSCVWWNSTGGKWDASESKCILCSGKEEVNILGYTASKYCSDGSSHICAYSGDTNGDTVDDKCESACGANTACDEVSDGGQCTTGKYCESLGRNCLSGDKCSGCICIPGAKPTISFSPSSFTFTAAQGGSNPANQTLEIWNSGTSGTTLNWSVSDNATWLSLSPTSGSSTGEHDNVTLSVNISGMTAGSYSGTITISDANATNSPRTVSVSLTITAPNLQISDIEDFGADRKVYYTIYNQGNASTGTGFNCSLYVGGTYKDYQYFSSALGAGLHRDGVFSGWTCAAGQTYSIKVCADDKNGVSLITESKEDDNCTTESLTCPTQCAAALSVSISGSGTCTVTAYLAASGCDGQSWQVKDNGTTKCSGTVSGSPYSKTCSSWTVGIGTYTYNLYIGGVKKDSDSVTCSTAANNPPSCDAGSDKTVNENQSVQLDCSASDPDGDSLSYAWSCTGGTLNNSSILKPTYTAPSVSADTNYTCTLNVADGKGGNCSDSMVVHVKDVPVGVSINPPVVVTIATTTVSEDSGHPGKYQAILTGFLDSLGYDPGTCTNCKCVVWFEWGTSGTAGVSGSYGNSNTPVEMTTEDDYFYYTADNLDPGTAFKFEAFAKNGGSW
jgi:hypothetical protein